MREGAPTSPGGWINVSASRSAAVTRVIPFDRQTPVIGSRLRTSPFVSGYWIRIPQTDVRSGVPQGNSSSERVCVHFGISGHGARMEWTCDGDEEMRRKGAVMQEVHKNEIRRAGGGGQGKQCTPTGTRDCECCGFYLPSKNWTWTPNVSALVLTTSRVCGWAADETRSVFLLFLWSCDAWEEWGRGMQFHSVTNDVSGWWTGSRGTNTNTQGTGDCCCKCQ